MREAFLVGRWLLKVVVVALLACSAGEPGQPVVPTVVSESAVPASSGTPRSLARGAMLRLSDLDEATPGSSAPAAPPAAHPQDAVAEQRRPAPEAEDRVEPLSAGLAEVLRLGAAGTRESLPEELWIGFEEPVENPLSIALGATSVVDQSSLPAGPLEPIPTALSDPVPAAMPNPLQ